MSEEPEVAVEFVELPYPFLETNNAKLRCFIAEHYLNAEIDGNILVTNMEAIYQWILKGKVSAKARTKPQLVKP
jgi:hypothetical protein